MKTTDRARCTAPGCRRTVHARSLCKAHYQRSRRGQPLSEIRPRGVRTGDVRVRVVLYLSASAAEVLASHGSAMLERFVEERAAVARKLNPDAAPVLVVNDDPEFDLYLNPPGAVAEETLP